jgi:hypothetical protein
MLVCHLAHLTGLDDDVAAQLFKLLTSRYTEEIRCLRHAIRKKFVYSSYFLNILSTTVKAVTWTGRPWRPPSFLQNGYRVSFQVVKRPKPGADQPPTSSAKVKESVELYLYYPSGRSWPLLWWNVRIPFREHGSNKILRNVGKCFTTNAM